MSKVNRGRTCRLWLIWCAVLGTVSYPSATLADESLWEQYSQNGINAYRQGRNAEAERYLQLAVKEAEGLGPPDLRLARSLHNLAMVYLEQGNYAQAEEVISRALAVKEKVVGLNSAEAAASLNNLGMVCFQQGKHSEAESFYKRVLAIDEKDLSAHHKERIISLENYALLLRRLGRFKEADELDTRADTLKAGAPDSQIK